MSIMAGPLFLVGYAAKKEKSIKGGWMIEDDQG